MKQKTGQNWTAILSAAGIQEPPGYLDTCKAVAEHRKSAAAVQIQAAAEQKAAMELKIAARKPARRAKKA